MIEALSLVHQLIAPQIDLHLEPVVFDVLFALQVVVGDEMVTAASFGEMRRDAEGNRSSLV